MAKVLVTGGSGFVGGHTILQLVAAGHEVCTTVRSAGRKVKDARVFVADLSHDDGWGAAVSGCDYVMHVASPLTQPDDGDFIGPARDGTLRVLRAARDAGVQRVVLTSSCGAIYYGYPPQKAAFTEENWTRLESDDMSPYVRSKAVAERAAWDFMSKEGGGMELAVINPAGIFGPVLGLDYAGSVDVLKRLLDGMPGCPRIYFGMVDVRDVADLHIRAMQHPAAKGERFIAVAGRSLSMLEISRVLRARLGTAAKRAPRFELPNFVVRLAARRDPAIRQLVPMLGKVREASSEKARRLLGWNPRGNEEIILATAESLIALTSAGAPAA